jgi:hypothetical protein
MQSAFQLSSPRGYAASAFNPWQTGRGRILVAGGKPDQFRSNVQLFSPIGWEIFYQLLEDSAQGCAVAINASVFIVIQGQNLANKSPGRTFLINVETNTVKEGPPMRTGRFNAACARMRDLSTGTYVVVVAGGIGNDGQVLKSTEILDAYNFRVWRQGAKFTYNFFHVITNSQIWLKRTLQEHQYLFVITVTSL